MPIETSRRPQAQAAGASPQLARRSQSERRKATGLTNRSETHIEASGKKDL